MKTSVGLLLVASAALLAGFQTKSPKSLTAPTYYIAAEARTCEPAEVRFVGASNLPPGAVVALRVSDFVGDGWSDYSDETYVSVNDKGFFEGIIQPRKAITFHRSLILVAEFTAYRPQQPSTVLGIIGKRGEELGGFENPQVGQVSGENFYLQTIARVPYCGEGIGDRTKQ